MKQSTDCTCSFINTFQGPIMCQHCPRSRNTVMRHLAMIPASREIYLVRSLQRNDKVVVKTKHPHSHPLPPLPSSLSYSFSISNSGIQCSNGIFICLISTLWVNPWIIKLALEGEMDRVTNHWKQSGSFSSLQWYGEVHKRPRLHEQEHSSCWHQLLILLSSLLDHFQRPGPVLGAISISKLTN